MIFSSRYGTEQSYTWDWYAFTPDMSRDDFLDLLLSDFEESYLETGRGRMNYTSSDLVFSLQGNLLCTVLHNSGSECHVICDSGSANLMAPYFRSKVKHYLSRADIALDYLDGDFDRMSSLFIPLAAGEGVKTRYIGPPQGQEVIDDSGRTLYLGSRSSVGMFRVYEKGKQLKCPDNPNWVRVEYEFKPQNRKAREFYSTCSVLELVSSTRISRAVLPLLAVEVGSSPCRAGQIPIDPDYHKTVRHLKKQYAKTLQRIAHDLDFDAEAFIKFMLE